jgi:outer membrane protein assembly factor BamE (lipoprotein component of BamABCDE complex)
MAIPMPLRPVPEETFLLNPQHPDSSAMKTKITPTTALLAFLALAALPLSGCISASAHLAEVEGATVDRLSVGTVQKEIRPGMSGADVVLALGAPNIVTTDEQRREVWVYDKIATQVVSSASGLSFSPLVLASGSIVGVGSANLSQSAGATSRSDRTLTIVIKFDEQKRVRDYAYHASQF